MTDDAFDRIVEGFSEDRRAAAEEWASVAHLALRRAAELARRDPEEDEKAFALFLTTILHDDDKPTNLGCEDWAAVMRYIGNVENQP